VAEGEEVVLETRDSVDGQVGPDMSAADLAHLDTGLVHPLTGPVFLKGAEPGDMLEVEFLDIVPQPTAFSVIIPHGLPPRHHDPAIRRALEDP
jgi:formamidase